MNIGLFGYGKMGKMIERIAKERGHTIVAKIDIAAQDVNFSEMDVAIDFSMPDAAYGNISNCFKNSVPVVSGTTGWLSKYDDAVALCRKENGAFIYASNFSLGVNIFFELNRLLAKMMTERSQYTISMEEIHHTQKLDAPSGTAITLAEGILKNSDYKEWKLGEAEEHQIQINSKRIGNVPGTHSVSYESAVDGLEINHTAHNREGFALGAIIAAEWIKDRTGIFSMNDVLGL